MDSNDVQVLKILLNAEPLDVVTEAWVAPKGTPMASNALGALYLPLEGLIDFSAEKTRLTKEREKVIGEIVKVEEKLANSSFTQKVPANVLAEHQQRLLDWKAKLKQLESLLGDLPE